MITVLLNIYACSPDMGSEPGLAWNWCVNLANHCRLHIITEGEFREKIEAALPKFPQAKNMHFYYNPVSDKVRKMCWNQGDWRFYWYYRKWQRKTLKIAESIVKNHPIDLIHQLGMIGFREPGYLWKINDIPFVWGPIGGLKQFPEAYNQKAELKLKLFNKAKNNITHLQIKYGRRVKSALLRANILIAASPDSYHAIKKHHGLKSFIIPDTGCYVREDFGKNINRFEQKEFNVIWVGKFDFRKQLELALRTIAKIKHLSGIKLSICGTGNEKQIAYYKEQATILDINDCIDWCGQIPIDLVTEKMINSSLFFITSVSDDTTTVVFEALSSCLPILCFDACGFGYVVNETVGIKIPFSNPDQSVNEFAEKIEYLYHNRDVLIEKSKNCPQRQQEFIWKNKAIQMVELYRKYGLIVTP